MSVVGESHQRKRRVAEGKEKMEMEKDDKERKEKGRVLIIINNSFCFIIFMISRVLVFVKKH